MNGNRVKLAAVLPALIIAVPPVAFTADAHAGASIPAILQSESPYAEEATQVSVELSKGVDSRSSKAGQEVTGKVVAEARMADGTTLPKGSRLIGHVTEVQPSTRENPNGQIAVLFDHVLARDGRQIPVHALLLGIRMPPRSAPPPMSGSDGVTGMGRGGMATPGMDGAGSRGPGMGGPAMNGGANSNGPVSPGGMNGGPPNGPEPGSGSGPASGLAPGPVNSSPASTSNGWAPGAAVGPAGSVAGLPGVTWGNVSISGSPAKDAAAPPPGAPTAVLFNGQGRNVTLDSGAQMVLAVTPQQSAPH
ncbi:MAG: hypothetical protein WA294_06205 [Acidobacteriaceae bacterium]